MNTSATTSASLQSYSRATLADLICSRIRALAPALTQHFRASGPIRHFVVDDVLPEDVAQAIASVFPAPEALKFKSTLRECKYVSSQMNQHPQLLEEALFAFQDPRLVSLVADIAGHKSLEADPMLYAGGVSSTTEGGFLNPHIDNSHNKQRERWRSLNLLYYVTPEWQPHFGGNLEVWPRGVKDACITLPSLFNRLVVMETHHLSWHSVSPVRVNRARNCISNYYFSTEPMHADQQFHITFFRGRPEQPLRDMILRADGALRMWLRKINPRGFFSTGHWYRQPPSTAR